MMCRTCAAIVILVLASGTIGCSKDGSAAGPTGPGMSPATNPPTPAGGVAMKGTVFDTAFRPLGGAVIEVLDGPQAGLSRTAGPGGEFSMTGVFDETTRFRATKPGHVTATRTLQPFCERCTPGWWINFALEVTGPSVNMGGDYTLTFVANSTCTMLPDETRSRTFTGTIPAGLTGEPTEVIRAGGATFFEDWNAIGIGVAGDYVSLWFEVLVEQIAPNTFLGFTGEAAATVGTADRSTFVIPFKGSIDYCVTTAEKGRYEDCYQARGAVRGCNSTHQLTLTKR